jgi:hypothetical protein
MPKNLESKRPTKIEKNNFAPLNGDHQIGTPKSYKGLKKIDIILQISQI